MCKAVLHSNFFFGCLTCSHHRTQGVKAKSSLTHLHKQMPSCSLTATVGGLQLTSAPALPTGTALAATYHTERPSNVLPSKFCFPHQATGMQPSFCAEVVQKNIKNSLSRPSIILYILIMSPFIQFFAGSLPWLVTPSSWEGFFFPILHHLAGLRPCEIFFLLMSY